METRKRKFVYRDHSEGTAKRLRMYGHIEASQKRAREKAEAEYMEIRRRMAEVRKERKSSRD